MRFQMLLSGEPSINGRSAAGRSETMTTHHPPATTRATKLPRSCPARRRNEVGAAIMYASPNAGTTVNACIIFVRNAKPRSVPTATNHFVPAFSMARVMQYAAPTKRSTRSASGLSKRNMSAATGVAASTAPATRPAVGLATRRTAA
jgi:hypothetical protein